MLSYIGMSQGNSRIAKILQEARCGLGLSQRELSQRSGLTQAQISRIENCAVDMRVSSLLALASELGLELNFTRQPPPQSPAVKSKPPIPRHRNLQERPVYGLAEAPQRPGIFGDIAEELL